MGGFSKGQTGKFQINTKTNQGISLRHDTGKFPKQFLELFWQLIYLTLAVYIKKEKLIDTANHISCV